MRARHLLIAAIGLSFTACSGNQAVDDSQSDTGEANAANQVLPIEPPANALAEGETAGETPVEAKSSAPAPRSPTGYRLIGTEPFWGGTASETSILYSTPDNQSGERIAVTRRLDGGREIYSGQREGRPFILTISDGPCSDGMSDNVHQYTARLEVDGEVRSGCANPDG